MQCVLQIFTGPYHHRNYTACEIVERLETVCDMLPVSKVILGWYPDASLYKEVGAFLHRRGIEMLLWLPVFSETGEFVPMSAAVGLDGKPIVTPPLQDGETFSFCCPSDPHNLQAVRKVYDTHFADVGFDGVFLDRIRTHSFVGGVSGVLSCGCAHCRDAYERAGVLLDEVGHAYDTLGDHFFDADEAGVFVCEEARTFFEAKACLIAHSVGTLAAYFKDKGLQVGMDVYAPLMSRFVGQDYARLAQHADFLKPMLYRRTEAPAGIGYEYALFKTCAPAARGYPPIDMSTSFLRSQAEVSVDCAIHAGIEVNYREDIAKTDADYIDESIRTLCANGMDGVTLSWDIMLAPDEHLRAVCEALREI